MGAASGTGTFLIFADHEEGAALLTCGDCSAERFVADSQRFLGQELIEEDETCWCLCGRRDFHVVIAAAFYEDGAAVRWWYVGGRCVNCGALGVYVDWKDDGSPWEQELRPRVG
jgi:hypothetical protein